MEHRDDQNQASNHNTKATVRIAAQIFQDKTVGYLYSETVIEWTRTQDEKIT